MSEQEPWRDIYDESYRQAARVAKFGDRTEPQIKWLCERVAELEDTIIHALAVTHMLGPIEVDSPAYQRLAEAWLGFFSKARNLRAGIEEAYERAR